MLLGDSAGIEYDAGLNDPDSKKTRSSLLAKTVAKYGKTLEDVDVKEIKEEAEEEDEEPKTGLMARRK